MKLTVSVPEDRFIQCRWCKPPVCVFLPPCVSLVSKVRDGRKIWRYKNSLRRPAFNLSTVQSFYRPVFRSSAGNATVEKFGGTKIVRVDLRSIFLPSNLFTVLCFPPGLNNCIFLSPVAHATGMTMPRVSCPDEACKLQV